ncbi:hypothetical protein ACLB2K_037649 [Fragaria x ananassa]
MIFQELKHKTHSGKGKSIKLLLTSRNGVIPHYRDFSSACPRITQMEDERRWEELEVDCLMNIFGRVGMESLLLDVPFVCKSWHKATLNPSSWQYLIFPDLTINHFGFDLRNGDWCTLIERFVDEYRLDESRFSVTAFVKFIISRSKGKAVTLRLSPCASEDVLKYAADESEPTTDDTMDERKWKDLNNVLGGVGMESLLRLRFKVIVGELTRN